MTQFTDYDRVADTLLYLSDIFTLDFVTVLSTKDKTGGRAFFHSETEYDSQKYNSSSKVKSIRRKPTFYFVINNKQSFDGSFVLRPQDVQLITMLIEQQIFPWYFDHSKRIFKIVEDKLVITGKFNPVKYVRNEYQYLVFTPCIYSFEDNTFKEGIRMQVSNSDYVDMEIDKFMGLYYILKNTDMYAVACSMVTYAKVPPYDVNVWKRVGLAGAYNSSQDDKIWNQDVTQQYNSDSGSETKKPNTFFNDLKSK